MYNGDQPLSLRDTRLLPILFSFLFFFFFCHMDPNNNNSRIWSILIPGKDENHFLFSKKDSRIENKRTKENEFIRVDRRHREKGFRIFRISPGIEIHTWKLNSDISQQASSTRLCVCFARSRRDEITYSYCKE